MSNNTTTYKGIYAMHKYWGKKPFNEISRFIEKYTVAGETILDSFCGSGITLVEALKTNRKCIGVDLNPIAIKLAKASMVSVDIDTVNKEFKSIKEKLQTIINSLYEVDENGEKTIITHTIWKGNEPIEVWYATNREKKKIRTGKLIDIEMSQNPAISPKWYPTTEMFENSRINVGERQKVSDLFTQRAIVGLSLILDEIKKIKDENIRDVFELTLSGTLSQASNLVFVIRDRKKNEGKPSKAEVGSWVIGYWVPEEHFEINIWNCFENRFKKILRGKTEVNKIFSSRQRDYFVENVKLINGSATNLSLDDNSIDYVFIDPPHANRVLYMEQSLMWNAWLNIDSNIDWKNEIVISEARNRKDKNSDNYNKLLSQAFKEIRRVLKPGKFFSMAFNCLDNDTWINTLNLFASHGFNFSDIIPLEYSATSVIQDNRKNALKTDFVLTFQNCGNNRTKTIVAKNDDMLLEKEIRSFLKNNPSCEVYNIINFLFKKTVPQGYLYRVSQIVKQCNKMM